MMVVPRAGEIFFLFIFFYFFIWNLLGMFHIRVLSYYFPALGLAGSAVLPRWIGWIWMSPPPEPFLPKLS